MKIMLVTFVAIATIFWASSSVQASAAYVESFDSNNASWNYGYGLDFSSPLNAATWVASGGGTGGGTGGYISGSSSNLYAVWTYATTKYGNMNGLTMTIDTKVSDSEVGNAQFYVGRGGTYFIDGVWSIGNDTSWTTHTVALNSANFTPWTGLITGIYTLDQVLQAPDDIGIFFGGSVAAGAGNVMVDNFGTVTPTPIPAAVWLFGSGLMGLVGLRRKMNS